MIPFNLNSGTGGAKWQRTDQQLPVADSEAGADCQAAQMKKELLRVTESFHFLMMLVTRACKFIKTRIQ